MKTLTNKYPVRKRRRSKIVMEVMSTINELMNDSTLPKGVKECLCEVKVTLREDGDWEVVKDSAIQLLEQATRDPNLPTFTRTQIWSIVTRLESKTNK